MKEGWKYEKLRDVTEKCTNIKWQNIPSTQECYYIDLSCVNRDIKQIENPQTINSANAPSRAKQIIREGDVLFGTTRPTLQRYCLINDLYDGQICSTGFCVLRPKRNIIHPKYLYYIFSTTDFYKYIEPLQSGANYPAVTDGDVKDYVAPIPSLSEQKRIVELLDAEFAKIDALKANAEQQLQAAKDLFQAALKERLLSVAGCIKRNFKDVLPIQMGKTPPRADSSMWDEKKVTNNLWVSVSDITKNEGRVIYSTEENISDKALTKMKMVKKGSLLMSFKLTIGKMAIAGHDLYTNEAIIAIPINDSYNLRFLYYFLSAYPWNTLTDGAEKVKGKTLNKTSIGQIQLPVIPIPDQQQIAAQLDAISVKVQQLQVNYNQTITLCNDLKQALLKSIFE